MSNNSLTPSTTSVPVSGGDVAAVREFNRCYTSVLGLLREGLLDTPYSLTEARIIFELARQDEVEVAAMRRWLDLDAGYLSRILARFEADGLVRKARAAADARRQVIALTPAACSACARAPGPRSCACCWWSRPRAAWASAGGWPMSAWRSPGGPGTGRSCCGPTTCCTPPGGSTSGPGSS